MDPVAELAQTAGFTLPPAVEALHRTPGAARYSGHCTVTRGASPLARLALWLGGFPKAGRDVPINLTTRTDAWGSHWHRDFGGHVTQSRMTLSDNGQEIVERFGPFRLHMGLRQEAAHLHYDLRRLRVFGLPLPRWLTPESRTCEFQTETGAFGFDVSASLPVAGLLIRYRGSLTPA